MNQGWIGVDLDGTLAEYTGWQGEFHIGKPVPRMVERVKKWLAEGRDVRIFTARISACGPDSDILQIELNIEKWLEEHIGRGLPITCCKDYGMIELWDDRCKQVVPNTGQTIEEIMDAERIALAKL